MISKEAIQHAFLLGFLKAAESSTGVPAQVMPKPQIPTQHVAQAPVGGPTTYSFIKGNEGFRPTNYVDTTHHKSIGYGSRNPALLRQGRITEPVAARDLTNHVNGVGNYANTQLSNWSSLNTNAQKAVVDLGYQVGNTGLSKFTNMLNQLRATNYSGAAHEMKDSLVNTQTPERNLRRIKLLLDAARQTAPR